MTAFLPRWQRVLIRNCLNDDDCWRLGFRGQFQDRIECEDGIQFEYQFHLERLTPEAFGHLQRAFADSPVVDGMMHQFQTSGRVNLAAFSYMYIDTRQRTFRIQAVHSFPDDYAVLKTQSLYRLPL